MKALPGYIIVESISEEDRTSSGFVLSSSLKDRPVKGRVVHVGPRTAGEEPPVSIGDVIFHRRYAGDEIKEGEREFRAVKFSDCIAIADE